VPVPAHSLAVMVGDRVDIVATAGDGATGEANEGSPFGSVVAHGARVLSITEGAVVVEVEAADIGRLAAALVDAPPVLALAGAP
jgi:Flp pilus assembly protein CpaB